MPPSLFRFAKSPVQIRLASSPSLEIAKVDISTRQGDPFGYSNEWVALSSA